MSKYLLSISIVWVVLALIIGVVLVVPKKSDGAKTSAKYTYQSARSRTKLATANVSGKKASNSKAQLKTTVRVGQKNVLPVTLKIKS